MKAVDLQMPNQLPFRGTADWCWKGIDGVAGPVGTLTDGETYRCCR